jgi:hypothetical protein
MLQAYPKGDLISQVRFTVTQTCLTMLLQLKLLEGVKHKNWQAKTEEVLDAAHHIFKNYTRFSLFS